MRTGAHARTREKWDAADFTLPTCALAYDYGVTETTVCYHRRKRGIDIRADRWRGVDWTRTNQDIADDLGLTPQAVSYQRRIRIKAKKQLTVAKRRDKSEP